ncbi:vitamin K epoxide reductase complex subunit 1-like protein 1 [Saccostrea echinata]|uniref:vitamin K epoxide reductase complex subunit 1-like protein 1 n=1 Tax=Saccostrea echinata TaxID=191078 RepID=UPI002A83AB9E|nr:vitamin K epoxide reductase complex subunit 1-like protein 1 [Saccostrea echinata]
MGSRSSKTSKTVILLCCAVGTLLSVYALYVEINAEHDKNYRASCDISPSVSCSKVFKSRWGKGFGLIGLLIGDDHPLNLPNSVFGIVFYTLQIALTFSSSPVLASLQFYMSALSNVASVYLGYILYFILKDLCVVCMSTYITNAVILVAIYNKNKAMQEAKKTKEKRKQK